MTLPMRTLAMFLGVLTLSAMLVGCGSHRVRGVVVEGDVSYIELVSKNDPRLQQGRPLLGATISATVDPQSLNSTALELATSRSDGTFAIPVDEFGAGWLEYELGLMVRRSGFAPAEGYVPLPGGDKRLLVILAPGRDGSGTSSAFDEDYSWERDVERYSH